VYFLSFWTSHWRSTDDPFELHRFNRWTQLVRLLEKCSLLEWIDAFSFITSLTGDHILSHCQWEWTGVVSSRNVGLTGEVNTLMASSCTLPLNYYASVNVLSLRHLLLLYLVISKQICNDLISTLIMIMYAWYVGLCILTSSRIPRLILRRRRTPLFKGGSVTAKWALVTRRGSNVAPSHANCTRVIQFNIAPRRSVWP
jgi:hypothetical protein